MRQMYQHLTCKSWLEAAIPPSASFEAAKPIVANMAVANGHSANHDEDGSSADSTGSSEDGSGADSGSQASDSDFDDDPDVDASSVARADQSQVPSSTTVVPVTPVRPLAAAKPSTIAEEEEDIDWGDDDS